MEKYMPINRVPRLLILICLFIPSIALSQVTTLVCNLPSGKEWGTLEIDLKQKTIIDINILQKASADYLEAWREKYNQDRGKESSPKTFDANQNATKFKITKATDKTIFGESRSWGHYKTIEINRYNLEMRYPEMPSEDVFKCAKVEKVF